MDPNQVIYNRPLALSPSLFAPSRHAFAAGELISALVILAILSAILAAMVPESRRRSQLAGSLTNQQRLGAAIADYGLEHDDSIVSYTWRAGETRTCGDLTFPIPISDQVAAVNQASCILRERTGNNAIPLGSFLNWIPHINYNLLPLMAYLDEPLPSRLLVSPGDRARLEWQRAVTSDPNDRITPYLSLECRPSPGLSEPSLHRFPYSSSYEMGPSFYSPDRIVGAVGTINQSSTHNQFVVPNSTPLGRRQLSEVDFPSHKAMLYETNQRYFGQNQAYFLRPGARIPVLFDDGSASVRSISSANDGWDPAVGSGQATSVTYFPETSWESPIETGATLVTQPGRIRWTQRGLEGRDFGAPEVAP